MFSYPANKLHLAVAPEFDDFDIRLASAEAQKRFKDVMNEVNKIVGDTALNYTYQDHDPETGKGGGVLSEFSKKLSERYLELMKAYVYMQEKLGIPAITNPRYGNLKKRMFTHDEIINLQKITGSDEYKSIDLKIQEIAKSNKPMAERIWGAFFFSDERKKFLKNASDSNKKLFKLLRVKFDELSNSNNELLKRVFLGLYYKRRSINKEQDFLDVADFLRNPKLEVDSKDGASQSTVDSDNKKIDIPDGLSIGDFLRNQKSKVPASQRDRLIYEIWQRITNPDSVYSVLGSAVTGDLGTNPLAVLNAMEGKPETSEIDPETKKKKSKTEQQKEYPISDFMNQMYFVYQLKDFTNELTTLTDVQLDAMDEYFTREQAKNPDQQIWRLNRERIHVLKNKNPDGIDLNTDKIGSFPLFDVDDNGKIQQDGNLTNEPFSTDQQINDDRKSRLSDQSNWLRPDELSPRERFIYFGDPDLDANRRRIETLHNTEPRNEHQQISLESTLSEPRSSWTVGAASFHVHITDPEEAETPEAKKYVDIIRRLGLPVMTGPSGTSRMFNDMAHMVDMATESIDDLKILRLAMMAFMIRAEDHSMVEMFQGLQSYLPTDLSPLLHRIILDAEFANAVESRLRENGIDIDEEVARAEAAIRHEKLAVQYEKFKKDFPLKTRDLIDEMNPEDLANSLDSKSKINKIISAIIEHAEITWEAKKIGKMDLIVDGFLSAQDIPAVIYRIMELQGNKPKSIKKLKKFLENEMSDLNSDAKKQGVIELFKVSHEGFEKAFETVGQAAKVFLPILYKSAVKTEVLGEDAQVQLATLRTAESMVRVENVKYKDRQSRQDLNKELTDRFLEQYTEFKREFPINPRNQNSYLRAIESLGEFHRGVTNDNIKSRRQHEVVRMAFIVYSIIEEESKRNRVANPFKSVIELAEYIRVGDIYEREHSDEDKISNKAKILKFDSKETKRETAKDRAFISAADDFNDIESQLQQTNPEYRKNLKHYNEQLVEYKSFLKPTKHELKIVYRGVSWNSRDSIIQRLKEGEYPMRINTTVKDRPFVSLFPVPEETFANIDLDLVDEDLKKEFIKFSGMNDGELKELMENPNKVTRRGYEEKKGADSIFPPNTTPKQSEYYTHGFSMSGVSMAESPESARSFTDMTGCILVGSIEESYPWYLSGGSPYESEMLVMGIQSYLFGYVESNKGDEIIVNPDKQDLYNEYVDYLEKNKDPESGIFVGSSGEKFPFDEKIRAMIFDKKIIWGNHTEPLSPKELANLRISQFVERQKHAEWRAEIDNPKKPSRVMGYGGYGESGARVEERPGL